MDLISREEYENYLKHEGFPGMHWGVRNGPPYPLNRTATGQISKKQEKAAAKTARKEAKAEAKTKQKANKKAVKILKKGRNVDPDDLSDEEKESMKKTIGRTSDIKLIMKYKDLFSTEELGTLSNRISAEQKLSGLEQSKLDKGMATLKKYRGYVDEALNVVNTGKKVASLVKEAQEAPQKAKEKADKEALDARKKSILDSKDWSQMKENSDLFTNSEISDFIKRRQQEDTIRKNVDAQKAATAEAVKQRRGNAEASSLGSLADSLGSSLDTHFKKVEQDQQVSDLKSMVDALSSNLDKEFKK